MNARIALVLVVLLAVLYWVQQKMVGKNASPGLRKTELLNLHVRFTKHSLSYYFGWHS